MNLVIVEGSSLVRLQLLRLIAPNPAITVTGWAEDEDSAVALILSSQADAVLLDIQLTSGSGVQALKRIRQQGSKVRVLVLTNHPAQIMRDTCEAWGVEGFYDKNHKASAWLDHLFSWVGQ